MADNRLVPISDQLIYNGVGPVDAKNIPVETVDNLPSDLVAYEGLRVYVKSECADFLYTKVNGELTWVKQTNGGEDIAPLSGSVVTLSASTVNIQNDVKNVSGDVITLADSLDEFSASTVTIENNVTNLSASTVVVENNLAELSASTVVVESGLTELSATTVDIEERLKELENAGLIRINIFDYLSDESIVESAQTANFYTTVYQFSGDTAKEIVNLDDYNNILSTFVKKGAFISNEANQFYDIASIMPTSDGNAGVESAVQLAFQMESIRIKPATESFIPVSLHGFIQITHYDNDNVIVSAAITSTDTPIVYALANLYEYAIGNVNTDEYLAGEIADNELNLSGNVVMVKDITESDYDVTNGEVEKQTWVFVYSDEGQSETFTYSAINYGTENGYYRWLFISEEGDKDYIYLDKMYAVNEVIPYYFYKEDDGSFERSDFGEEETLTVADEVYGEDITIPNKKALADVYDVKNEIGFKNIVKSFTATYENTSIINLERNTEEDVNEYYGWTASICGSTDTMIIYTQTLSISDGDTITLYADDGAGSYQSADYAVSNVAYRTTGLYKFVNDKIINSKDSRYITIDKNPEVLSINAKTSYIDGINLSDVENIRITAHALGLYTLWERHTEKDEQGYYAWKVINSDESDGCVYTKEIPSLGDSISLYQKNDEGEFISEGVLGTVEVLGLNSTYLSLNNNYTFDDPSVTIDNLPYHKGMKAFYCDNSEKNEDGYYHWVGCLLTDFNPVTVAYGEFYSTELPSSVSQEIDIYSKDESGYTDTLINAVVKEFKLSSPYSIDTDGLAMTADVKKHLKNLADKMGEISGKTCTVFASGDTYVEAHSESGNTVLVNSNVLHMEDIKEPELTNVKKETWFITLLEDGSSDTYNMVRLASKDIDDYAYWYILGEDKDYGIYTLGVPVKGETIDGYYIPDDDKEGEMYHESSCTITILDVFGEYKINQVGLADAAEFKNEIGFANITTAFTGIYIYGSTTTLIDFTRNEEYDTEISGETVYGWTAFIGSSSAVLYTNTYKLENGDDVTVYIDNGYGDYNKADMEVSNVERGTSTGIYGYIDNKIINSKDGKYFNIDKNPEVLKADAKSAYIDNSSLIESMVITIGGVDIFYKRVPELDIDGYYRWADMTPTNPSEMYTTEMPNADSEILVYARTEDGEFVSAATVQVSSVNASCIVRYSRGGYTYDSNPTNNPFSANTSFYTDGVANEDGYYQWKSLGIRYATFYSTEIPSTVGQEIDMYYKDESGYTDYNVNICSERFHIVKPYNEVVDGLAIAGDVKNHLDDINERLQTVLIDDASDEYIGFKYYNDATKKSVTVTRDAEKDTVQGSNTYYAWDRDGSTMYTLEYIPTTSADTTVDTYSYDETIGKITRENSYRVLAINKNYNNGLADTLDVKAHLNTLADKMGEISGKTCTVFASGDTFVGVAVEGGNAIHVSANTMTVDNAYAAHDLNTTEVWDNNGTEVTLTYAGGDKARESYIKYDGSDGKTYLKYKVIPNRLLVYNEDEGRYEWSDYTFVSAESTHYNEVNGLTTALDVQKEISAITVESKNQYILTSLTGTSLTGLTAVVKMIDEAVESGYTITSFIAQNSRGILNPDGDVTECYPESDLDELPYYAYKTMLGDVFYTKKTPIQIAKGVSAEFFKKENDEFVSVGTVTIGDVDKHYISATFAMADVLDVKRHLTALADENDDLRKRVAKLEEQMAAVLNNITVNPEQ